MHANPDLQLRVKAIVQQSDEVKSVTLVSAEAGALPSFTAGSHIELAIPGAHGKVLQRHYSLLNDPAEDHRYVIGVGLHPSSRGGSRFVHEALQVGQLLGSTAPRNHFALVETASYSVLIAGGIGVTPLLCMARRLSRLSRPWRLYYCVRTPARAAYLDQLMQLEGGEVVPVYDSCPGISALDIAEVAAAAAPTDHLYCCGPAGMLAAFERATAHRDPSTVHLEWFDAPAALATGGAAQDAAFTVHLARSGRSVSVPPGRSILAEVEAAGVDVPNSCGDGICGSCETSVLAGRPLHRDHVLTESERTRGDRMMVCVSRSLDAELTLDL